MMWTLFVIVAYPHVEICLQLVDRTIHSFAERDTIELVEHGLMEALSNSVRLGALGLGARVIDVLDRKIEFVFVPLRVAAIFAAAIGEHAPQLDASKNLWPNRR